MSNFNFNTDYWFFIEPYVFVSICDGSILLYNTLDGKYYESKALRIVDIVKLLNANHGVVKINHEELKKPEVADFISFVRNNYFGDIIDISLSSKKPFQLLPIYSYVHDTSMLKTNFLANVNDLSKLVSEVMISINTIIDEKMLLSFINQIAPQASIYIKGDYDNSMKIINRLSKDREISSIKYVVNCKQLDILEYRIKELSLRIDVDSPFLTQRYIKKIEQLPNYDNNYSFVFKVASEQEIIESYNIINKLNLTNYIIKPVFNKSNYVFLEKTVNMSKVDILSGPPVSLKQLYAHHVINTWNFGRIVVREDGDVYGTNGNICLGNIKTDSLSNIVLKEINDGNSWFNIRNKHPCNKCLFQWLCPSPSKYEAQLGENNMCNVWRKK